MKTHLILIAIFSMIPTFAHAEAIATSGRENFELMDYDPDHFEENKFCPDDQCRAESNRPTFNGKELPFTCSFSKSFRSPGQGSEWPNLDLEAISANQMAMDDEDDISYLAEFVPGTNMSKRREGQPLTHGNRIKLTITHGNKPAVIKYINAQPGSGGSVTMGRDASYEGTLGTMEHTLHCQTY